MSGIADRDLMKSSRYNCAHGVCLIACLTRSPHSSHPSPLIFPVGLRLFTANEMRRNGAAEQQLRETCTRREIFGFSALRPILSFCSATCRFIYRFTRPCNSNFLDTRAATCFSSHGRLFLADKCKLGSRTIYMHI